MSKVFFGLLLLFLVFLAYFAISDSKKTWVFTTNVDIANKEIIDDSADQEDTEVGYLSAIASVANITFNTIKNDMSMLAAAANPSTAFLKITPGMRKEQIAELLQKKLGWDETQVGRFLNINRLYGAKNTEGYYYPDSYIIPVNADGFEVGRLMMTRFNEKIFSHYASSTEKMVDIDTAMKIASILEREASGKKDMRIISGIIWNRLFKDMSLDIDATLQYAKGSEDNGWWPKVVPEDKFITSPYNTYQNKGLTPTAISNPQIASIEAALNPKKTNCLFYLHDKYRRFHCSTTYKEHVKNIARYYGGR